MTDEEYELSIKLHYIAQAKAIIKEAKDYLTNSDVIELVNHLITFENSHLIATNLKDDKVAYALYQELKQYFKEY